MCILLSRNLLRSYSNLTVSFGLLLWLLLPLKASGSPLAERAADTKLFIEIADIATTGANTSGQNSTIASKSRNRIVSIVNQKGEKVAEFSANTASGELTPESTEYILNAVANHGSSQLKALITISLAFSIGLLFVIGSLYHSTLRPLSKLSKYIRTVSSTSNLTLRAPVLGSPVVRSLANSFNSILNTTEEWHLEMLQARYEVESASKGKSLFIAKVSHELRTPIHGITGMLRILLKQEQQGSKRQYLQMAQESAQSLINTINDILDFSKVESGDLLLEHKPFDFFETVRATVQQVAPRYEEKSELNLCWNIHPDIPERLVGDGGRVRNILFNLLGNAFKFTERGHVILDITPYNTHVRDTIGVRISVSDTGIGIAKEKAKQIFDPFTTADESTARLYAGTGLGLAIVKQVVDQMGGRVSVESAPGRGSTFTVEIPFPEPDEPSLVTPIPRRIAVLAEDDIRRRSISNGLRGFRCSVFEFDLASTEDMYSLANTVSSFDAIHIIKGSSTLVDELHPVLRNASRNQVDVVLSVCGVDIPQTDTLPLSEKLIVTMQPTSAYDLLMILQGHLAPSRYTATTDEPASFSGNRLRILVADDAKTNRVILKNLLEEAGHSVEVVENGQQLLERLSKSNYKDHTPEFDVVLTDIQMPIMDGITATQSVRQREREQESPHKLPIVAVTSYAFPEECNKMLAMGIDHIITKPISPKGLNQLLSQIGADKDTVIPLDQEAAADVIEQLRHVSDDLIQRLISIDSNSVIRPLDSTIAVVDVESLFNRAGNSLRRAEEILSDFTDSYQEPLKIIESATTPLSNPSTVRGAVHSLKGLLLDAGATEAASFILNLEKQIMADPESVTSTALGTAVSAVELAAFAVNELITAMPSVQAYSALPSMDEVLEALAS